MGVGAATRSTLTRALRVSSRPWPRGSARASGAAIVVVALAAGVVARQRDVDLGAATAPLFWSGLSIPASHPWWPLPSLVLALALGLWLTDHQELSRRAFLAGAFVLALGARMGLAVAQHGVAEWSYPLVRSGARSTEYPAAYPTVRLDPLGFIDHFAELVPVLPVHPSGHPVGATLAFWGLDRLAGGSGGSAAALLVIGAAAVAPVLWLGRALHDEVVARRAVVIFALAPVTLIYGATSYDAAFATVGATCAWLLVTRRTLSGAVAAAAAFLLSYALALVPLWAALTLARRGGVRVAVACMIAALTTLAALWLVLGYDPIGAVRATHAAYERGIGGRRPQWYWILGGPAAFLIVLGPLLGERLLCAAERAISGARALIACLLLGVVSGVMEAEVERIWQFAVPLAAVSAAPLLRSRRWLVVGLALGLAEAYLIELRWDTTF